jgi:uncharacterized protein (DUF488 family)
VATIYTIGHSTRTIEELIAALKAHGIEVLFDIRAFPASRRMPWFARDALEKSLPEAGIEYIWKKELGGHRGKQLAESPNIGLRNVSFRNYADYMLTPDFQRAGAEVIASAEAKRTAVMCAERMFFQCHRMLVSDYLALHGHEVLHIVDTAPVRPHRITPEAKFIDGRVIYPGLF